VFFVVLSVRRGQSGHKSSQRSYEGHEAEYNYSNR